MILIMLGAPGTGKGTVCKEVLDREDALTLSVSATTREKRKGEVDGETYHYVTKDDFEAMIDKGEMLEYATYNGNYYGTPMASVDELLSDGRDVMLEIRLITRGRESETEIAERIANAKWELEQADKYTVLIENDDLDECVDYVLDYIESKRKERKKIIGLINETV